jgi:hypothetical protein
MTYTAVNPHACCNRPRPEDAHAAARSPPHPHASPHLTNSDGLRWKTDGRPPANGPPTETPQQRRHSPSTPARGPPRPPTPRPSPQPPPPPSQSQGQVPITEQKSLYRCLRVSRSNFSKAASARRRLTHHIQVTLALCACSCVVQTICALIRTLHVGRRRRRLAHHIWRPRMRRGS